MWIHCLRQIKLWSNKLHVTRISTITNNTITTDRLPPPLPKSKQYIHEVKEGNERVRERFITACFFHKVNLWIIQTGFDRLGSHGSDATGSAWWSDKDEPDTLRGSSES